ncbi:MAG: hypothetical protein ABFS32_06985 [Bacteroidota bacterium]
MKRCYLIIFIYLLLFNGCIPEIEKAQKYTYGDVKSVETTYISHQADTQEKDNRRVAVAHFNPDGSFARAMQYMTYPYTNMNETEFVLWTEPKDELFMHILDGLSLDNAEKNFIYGNDWPKAYANLVKQEGHPKFPKRQEPFSSFFSSIDYEQGLPKHIKTEPNFKDKEWFMNSFEERFSYDNNKVAIYERRHLLSVKMKEKLLEEQKEKWQKVKADTQTMKFIETLEEAPYEGIYYEYDGDNLTSVKDGSNEHRFTYENDVLLKAEYFINEKLRNHRIYYYHDNGLKEKTVLYNTFNEPEYTIEYSYEFYEDNEASLN